MVEKIQINLKGKSGQIVCSNKLLKMIRERFSIKNPSYHSRRFAPRLYAITPSGAFQIGLWNEIQSYIYSLSIPVNIKVSKDFQVRFSPKTNIFSLSEVEGYSYYDYQEETLAQFIEHGRGISLIATGGGKSVIQAGLVKTFLDHYPHYKILIVVPNVSLLNQLYYSFTGDFGIKSVTRWGDGHIPDLSNNVLIANNQILINDIPYTISVVKNYNVVIVDEVHTINEKKNKISKVIHNIDTPFKFGLTGTLPDSMMGAWNVVGKIGPIVYEKNSFELRKQETISEVEIRILLCKHSKKPISTVPFVSPQDPYIFEYDYVVANKKRNDMIAKIAEKLEGNTLIAIDRLNHIDELKKSLQNSKKKIFVITGETPTEERTNIQNTMDQEDNIICIAMSKCFSTGISINNLHYAIFTYMGKGGVKTVQTIGRTVRKHPSKKKAIIFDVADDLTYSTRHLKERVKIYKDQKIDYKITKITI